MGDIAVEPGIVPAEPAAPEPAPAEPTWAPPSEEEWYQQQNELTALRDYYQQNQAPPQPEPGIEFDPFSDNPGGQLESAVSRILEKQLAPYSDFVQRYQAQENHELLLDAIDDEVKRNGEFMLGEQAYDYIIGTARALMPESQQRYGNTNKAAEVALERAAAQWRTIEQSLAEKAVERHTNQLSTLSGAPREPGVAGVAGQLQTGAKTVEELISKYTGVA